MKFKRKMTFQRTSEVRELKAPKGEFFQCNVNAYEAETGKRPAAPHFFNKQGSVCCWVSKLYEVLEDGVPSGMYVSKKMAVKEAKEYVNGLADQK